MERYIAVDSFIFLIFVAILAMVIAFLISIYLDSKAKKIAKLKKREGDRK